MKRLIVYSLFIFVGWTATADEMADKLNQVLKSAKINRDQLGLYVVDLTNGKQRFGLNEDKLMIPASLTKVATGAAALEKFGPSHKFVTTLWSNGVQKDDVLEGDLILKGGGDPGFVAETMWFLINDFYRNGIRKINGNIVVDDSYFDDVRTDASRDPGRVDRAYDAPIGAMSFNWNSVNIFIRPTKVGEKVIVKIDPDLEGWTIDNGATTKKGDGNNLEVSRVGDAKIQVGGSLGVNSPEIAVYKNIEDPADWSGQNLKYFLQQRGISISGKVKKGKTPDGARQLAKAEGKPVSYHVADMMKVSNNYVAEMLTKNMGAEFVKTPGRLEDGMTVINGFLKELGLDSSKYKLINPSGLSRKNNITPKDLALILQKMNQRFTSFAEYLSAFPLAGVDGTLKKRMKGSLAQGRVRAKTGLLTGAIGLAGYIGHRDGSTMAFAFIFNGPGEKGEEVRQLFDRLAIQLVE